MFQTQQYAISPFQAAAVRPAQLDISSLISQIIPIFTLMLVFGMLMPMMKQMSRGFGD